MVRGIISETMEKHWTAYLPEAGRIRRKGDDILHLNRLLVQAKTAVKDLKRTIADHEELAFNMARADWTIEEITEAKLKAKQNGI
jgi:hypothetical protein